MIETIVVGSIALVWGAWIGTKLQARTSRPTAPAEPTCTGYNAWTVDARGKLSETYFPRTDCQSLRSPTCMDGRCTYHCRHMCHCDQPKAVPRPIPPAINTVASSKSEGSR